MYGKVFGVIRVFFILLEVQLAQQLAGFDHGVIQSSVVETFIWTINLQQSNNRFTKHTDDANEDANG